PYLTEQWRNKQLHLIGIPGASQEEQEQQFVRFLDGLSEHVALRSPRLFLAPDVDIAQPLEPLRGVLTRVEGRAIDNLIRGATPAAEVDLRRLASTLAFLTEDGWRPDGRNGADLCRLWEHVAGQARDVGGRRQWLIVALACAEAYADVQRIRRELA